MLVYYFIIIRFYLLKAFSQGGTWSGLCFGSQSVWLCGEGNVRIEEEKKKSGKKLTYKQLVLEICPTDIMNAFQVRNNNLTFKKSLFNVYSGLCKLLN